MTYESVMRQKGLQPRVWPGCGGEGRCRPCGRIHDFGPGLGLRCWENHHHGCPQPRPASAHDFNRAGRCRTCGVSRLQSEAEERRRRDSQALGVALALRPASDLGREIDHEIALLAEEGLIRIDPAGNVSLTDAGEKYARERLTPPRP